MSHLNLKTMFSFQVGLSSSYTVLVTNFPVPSKWLMYPKFVWRLCEVSSPITCGS